MQRSEARGGADSVYFPLSFIGRRGGYGVELQLQYLGARRARRSIFPGHDDLQCKTLSPMLVGPRATPFAAVILLAMTAGAYSAVLSAPDLAGAAGQSMIASLSLDSEGQAVSGLQFDLDWDDTLDVRIFAGDRLRQSSRVLYSSPVKPRGVRYLIIGMDQGILSDGELLKAFVTVSSGSQPGTARIRVTNAVATDAGGRPIAVRFAPVNVKIQGGGTAVSLLSQGVLNAASLLPGAISPGMVITLLGYFRSAAPVLFFNGIQAPTLYAGPGQVNAIVPFALSVGPIATLEVRGDGQPTASLPLATAPVSPAVFTQAGTGIGPGAILNEDYSGNSFLNPAAAGSVVMVYGTGFGSLDPPAADGEIAGFPARTTLPVSASIGDLPAEVLYAGAAPGLVAGVVQVNLRIPSGLAPNLAAPVSVTIGSATTPAGVTVSIR